MFLSLSLAGKAPHSIYENVSGTQHTLLWTRNVLLYTWGI